jgi:NAD(P)-dependent dehydrogenase (short-subunit alcohol dehydrogenase family)
MEAAMASELAGKVALITGAGSGIGRATALLFASEGAAIVVADVDAKGGEDTVRLIASGGGKAVFVRCDVSNPEHAKQAAESVKNSFGQLDILFNNAGIISRRSVVDTSIEEWDRVTGVNLRGVFLMSKFAIPLMSQGGCIVNTGSGWGLKGGRNAASYCATKGAVVNLTRAMALDHADQNIRVNCICPGDTLTQMLVNEQKQLNVDPDEFMKDAAARPLNRAGKPEEIAQAALYLCTARSSFVTGSILVVDGGGLAG